jgi:hypothetical protein
MCSSTRLKNEKIALTAKYVIMTQNFAVFKFCKNAKLAVIFVDE